MILLPSLQCGSIILLARCIASALQISAVDQGIPIKFNSSLDLSAWHGVLDVGGVL